MAHITFLPHLKVQKNRVYHGSLTRMPFDFRYTENITNKSSEPRKRGDGNGSFKRNGDFDMLFEADPNGGILFDQSGQNTMEYLVIGTILIAAVIIVAGVLAALIKGKASSIGW